MTQPETVNKSKAFAPEVSVFVSANAGSGKTSLLANRVLSLLLSGVPPARILCLTFTKAAAAEMSNRILKQLGTWVMMPEAALSETIFSLQNAIPDRTRLQHARSLFAQVLEAPDGLKIETIHGFCQTLLKRFPIEAGISPHFFVMDDRTEQEMLAEARLRLFNDAHAQDKELQRSIRAFARRLSESSLRELLNEIIGSKQKFYALLQKYSGAPGAVEAVWKLAGLPPDIPLTTILHRHFDYDQAELSTLRGLIAKLLQGKNDDRRTAAGLTAWLEHRTEALVHDYCSAFLTQEGEPRKHVFNKNTLTAAEEQLLLQEQQRIVAFYADMLAREVADGSAHLLRIAAKLLEIYDQLKRAYARLDYDDLILHSVALLQRQGIAPWVLFKLDGGIDHVLVDEAQDTSPEQWTIIKALTDEFFSGKGRAETTRSLFVVGDEKQSIFSFQGADVKELALRQKEFIARIEAAGMPYEKLPLIKSYRSTNEVLNAVDAVFARPEASEGLMFEETKLAHIPTRGNAPGLVELWPVLEAEDVRVASLQLARQMADTIRQWLEDGTAQAQDIMVLVRRRNAFVDQLSRALKRRGVPVAGIDRMILSKNLAVQDLLALGQILLLPEDDLTLAALLKSPIFFISEENLFDLAWQRGERSLWEQLAASGQQSCRDAHALLTDLRARVDFVSPYELYAYVLDTLGARRRFTGRMGEEYADPIDEFMMQAMLYEQSHTPSLQGYLHWMMNSEGQIKRDMEQARNHVRIMTVHGAKGLQAPIVLLPDTTGIPKNDDALLWHESGLPLWSASSKRDDGNCLTLRAGRHGATHAEYRRLLYVALTRAENRLYVFGATGKDKVSAKSWYQLVKDGIAPLAAAFTNPLGEGLRIGSEPVGEKQNITALPERQTEMLLFLQQPPPEEPAPPKPLAPSRLPGDEPAAASPLSAGNTGQRGTFIHLLLQHLPQVPENERLAVAKRLAAGFQLDALDACIQEALHILTDPQFAFLFAEGSAAEVPIAGTVTLAGKKCAVSGQIDRLYVDEKQVWLVDYKTNRLPPASPAEIPKAYLRQLALYKALLREIYPGKTVRCALLWTAVAKIELVDEGLLDEKTVSSYI